MSHRPGSSWSGALNRLFASRKFQKWAASVPFVRGFVRRDGEAMFDLVAGFCHSQVLMALVEFDILDQLMEQEASVEALALRSNVPADRMRVLLRAGVALKLLVLRRNGDCALSRKGAALTGVPGLGEMIRHHRVFYRDLQDPVAFFREGGKTELAAFWPYVFGAAQAEDPDIAATYSDLMAQSQALVADDTLRAVSLKPVKRLMDVGGGTGAFLTAAAQAWPHLDLCLFDLPAVVSGAEERFSSESIRGRVEILPGSFRDDPIPTGADMISLVRVLYDHSDSTVLDLLRAVYTALPPGGQLLVSEPMTGGDQPERAGDAYFALYTMAMGTGRTRSAREIEALCVQAGFENLRHYPAPRPFVTRVLTARRPNSN
ncbi:MAG: methyltransferase [Sedimentitalea sp.]